MPGPSGQTSRQFPSLFRNMTGPPAPLDKTTEQEGPTVIERVCVWANTSFVWLCRGHAAPGSERCGHLYRRSVPGRGAEPLPSHYQGQRHGKHREHQGCSDDVPRQIAPGTQEGEADDASRFWEDHLGGSRALHLAASEEEFRAPRSIRQLFGERHGDLPGLAGLQGDGSPSRIRSRAQPPGAFGEAKFATQVQSPTTRVADLSDDAGAAFIVALCGEIGDLEI